MMFILFLSTVLLNPWQAFTLERVARSQLIRYSEKWQPEQRDCAGFIRFVYRESLGISTWNTAEGPLPFASAKDLITYNFERIGDRFDPLHIQTGDLLVYHHPLKKTGERWHLMMVLAPQNGLNGKGFGHLIYHTGSKDQSLEKPNEMRERPISVLYDRRWQKWRPDPNQFQFLGLYRLKRSLWEKKS